MSLELFLCSPVHYPLTIFCTLCPSSDYDTGNFESEYVCVHFVVCLFVLNFYDIQEKSEEKNEEKRRRGKKGSRSKAHRNHWATAGEERCVKAKKIFKT